MTISQIIHYLKGLIQSTSQAKLTKLEKVMDHFSHGYGWGEGHVKYDPNKHAISLFERFVLLLTELEKLNLTSEKKYAIEAKLDSLDLQKEVRNKRRYLAKRLKIFEAYLRKKHNIHARGFYSWLGMFIGGMVATLGLLPIAILAIMLKSSEIVIFSVSMVWFLAIVFVCIHIGRKMDTKAEKKGKILMNYYFLDYAPSLKRDEPLPWIK